MSSAAFVIKSEDDAWNLLKQVCGDTVFDSVLGIKFENWPILEIKLSGEQFNSTLTTKMMEGFIDLQKNIHRTYAKLYHNQANSRFLTDDEKKRMELLIQVLPGSSEYKVNLQDILEKFVQGVAGKMAPKHVVILAIAGGLMWSGTSAWRSYLENQKAIKGIEMQQLAGEQETQRMKIFADAMKHEPHLAAMKADTEEMYNTMLKGASGAKTVNFAGAQIDGSDARKLVRPTRTPSSEVRLDGSYRILKIDNSKMDHFEVKVNDGNGLVFTAKLDQSVIITSEQNKHILEGALWSRQPVRLMIQGTKVRDEITQATILDVMDKYDNK